MKLTEVKDFANQIQHDFIRKAFDALLEYIDELETAIFRLETVVINVLLEDTFESNIDDYEEEENEIETDQESFEIAEEIKEETDAISFGETEGVPEDQSPGDLPEVENGAWSGDSSESEEEEKKEEEIS